MGGIVDSVTDALGFTGGAEDAAAFNMDPAAYKELYEQALKGIQDVGTDPNSRMIRGGLENATIGQIEGLENQSAGRKANFEEDMARGFQADVQNLARAKGGTGTLAQALRPSGEMYDAQARARSRGLNDLYSQATQDIGNLQGIQGNFFNQDMGKAQSAANLATNELASRRGTQATNLDNQWNAEQSKKSRFADTLGAAGGIAGRVAKPHTFVGKAFGG